MLSLRKGMNIVLAPKSHLAEVLAAISQWAEAAFIACLAFAILDRESMPRTAVFAAFVNAVVITTAMGLLRGLVLWRHRNRE
ncbi:hypothetical protein [Pseudoduganella sp. R-34]|uniref:hypothetical protein n=1 Tax=Pseudoduganella sp. R-34 TaxID=3404062 RepID=UPI003CF7D98C